MDLKSSSFLDCTLRDGGYYNAWDFCPELILQYLDAMQAAGVDVVELGFRTLKNQGFQGPCAFTTDEFIRSLTIPGGLTIGVMVNGNELVGGGPSRKPWSDCSPTRRRTHRWILCASPATCMSSRRRCRRSPG